MLKGPKKYLQMMGNRKNIRNFDIGFTIFTIYELNFPVP